MQFCDRLKVAMQQSGVRPNELAKAAEIDIANVSHMLAGQRKPGVDTLARILEALPNVDARWLVTGVEPQ